MQLVLGTFDGGCVVQPGVGSLVSLAMVVGVLAVAWLRRIKGPQDR